MVMRNAIDRFVVAIRIAIGAGFIVAWCVPTAAQESGNAPPTVFHATEQPALTALAKRAFAQMQGGKLDRGLFSPSVRDALDDDRLALAAQQLQSLGTPAWSFLGEYHPPSGSPPEIYLLKFSVTAFRLQIAVDRTGKITSFFLSPAPEN